MARQWIDALEWVAMLFVGLLALILFCAMASCTIHHRVTIEFMPQEPTAVIETDAEPPEPQVILEAEP